MAVMSPQHPPTQTSPLLNPETKSILPPPILTDESRPVDVTNSEELLDRSVKTTISSPPHSSPIEEPNGTTTATTMTNGNYTAKDNNTAPPSPPIPTPPPLHVATNMAHDHPGLSELSITSPPPPTTATPALVDQVISDVRSSPQPMDTEQDAPAVPTTTQTNASMTEAELVKAEAPATALPELEKPGPSTPAGVDSEMADAPHIAVSAEPATTPTQEPEQLAGRIRGRSDSAEADGGRPQKRIKSEDLNDKPVSPKDQTMSEAYAGAGQSNARITNEAAIRTPMSKAQQRHCSNVTRSIKRTKDAGPFVHPVDHIKLNIPTYYDIVKVPMTITGIEKNLKMDAYSTVEDFISDFRIIIANTVLFNGPDNPITMMGKRMEESFDRQMKAIPPADKEDTPAKSKKKAPPPTKRTVTPAAASTPVASAPTASAVKQEHVKVEPNVQTPILPKVDTKARRESTRGNARSPVSAGSPTFSLNPSGMPLIRRDSLATTDGRPKRPIHPPPPRDLPYSDLKPRRKKAVAELKYCESVVKELQKKQHETFAYPFYHPVDPVALNIPDYFKVIKKPMDLESIQKKLKQNEYDGSADFEADVRLMFSNCYKFNPPDSIVYEMGKKLEDVFDQKWRDKPNFHEQQYDSASPQPEDQDEDMSEDDAADEDNDQVIALQQQVEEMQRRLEQIQKKKASPPAANRHKKRPSVSAASAPPPKKAAPSKRSGGIKKKRNEEVPYITFEQKQELSERINNLTQSKLGQALAMIKEEMPHLQKLGAEEIELDIDDLSPTVLHKLYKFVSKNTAAPAHAQPPIQAPAAHANSAKPRAVPKQKKNKPMSATEQERQIKELEAKVKQFEGGDGAGPRSLASMGTAAAADESSSDDESSSGSESEEE